jgi:hypothetical protein
MEKYEKAKIHIVKADEIFQKVIIKYNIIFIIFSICKNFYLKLIN